MKRSTRFALIVCSAALACAGLFALAGCGTSGSSTGATTGSTDTATTTYDADHTIKVAASPTPHAEILAEAKTLLAAKGYDLEVTEYTDYVMPNQAVTDGEVDANYFQHQPYLDDYNAQNGTDIVSAASIHFEPMGIFAGTKSSLSDLADGDKIAVPNDTTNEARALLLLQDQGIITLNSDAGVNATVNDITDNPKNITFYEVEAAAVPSALGDCAFAVINGNYALSAGLKISDALATEGADSLAATTYANIIACEPSEVDSAKIKALVEVMTSDDIRDFINSKYQGAVVPVF